MTDIERALALADLLAEQAEAVLRMKASPAVMPAVNALRGRIDSYRRMRTAMRAATSIHKFGDPLRPTLTREVRRDDALEAMFYHITVEMNDGKFCLDFMMPDGSPELDIEGTALSAAQKIGFLLKPWLMEMIEKTAR